MSNMAEVLALEFAQDILVRHKIGEMCATKEPHGDMKFTCVLYYKDEHGRPTLVALYTSEITDKPIYSFFAGPVADEIRDEYKRGIKRFAVESKRIVVTEA